MAAKRTFVDAGVLIAAFKGEAELKRRALEVLGDPDRSFVVNRYLMLEVLPKPTYQKRDEELQFMQAFFSGGIEIVEPCVEVADSAMELACTYRLQPCDALHAATAWRENAEFVTAEGPTKPFMRIQQITQRVSIRDEKVARRGFWYCCVNLAGRVVRRGVARYRKYSAWFRRAWKDRRKC